MRSHLLGHSRVRFLLRTSIDVERRILVQRLRHVPFMAIAGESPKLDSHAGAKWIDVWISCMVGADPTKAGFTATHPVLTCVRADRVRWVVSDAIVGTIVRPRRLVRVACGRST